MTEKIKKQILEVRDTALINMLDFKGVQQIAEMCIRDRFKAGRMHPEDYRFGGQPEEGHRKAGGP